MSKKFYKYISEKIIKYFQLNQPKSGDKFYIQFESDNQVQALYEELKNNIIAQEYIYSDIERKQEYKSYQLVFNSYTVNH